MPPITDKNRWLEEFRKTTEALERIHDEELANMTDEEALRQIRLLSIPGKPWRERPDWSGLVEQQALFHRRKSR